MISKKKLVELTTSSLIPDPGFYEALASSKIDLIALRPS